MSAARINYIIIPKINGLFGRAKRQYLTRESQGYSLLETRFIGCVGLLDEAAERPNYA